MKSASDGLISKLNTAKERTGELKDRSIQPCQTESIEHPKTVG